MNRRKIIELLVALISGISVAVGQSFLLSFLFPSFMTAYGIWVLLSLLCFNCGLGIRYTKLNPDRFREIRWSIQL